MDELWTTRKKFRDYQQEAYDRFENERSAFLAMEMRLGKSLVALRLVEKWRAERVLILAPKTTLLSWEDELNEEGYLHAYLNVSDYPVATRAFFLQESKYRFYLCNYESVAKLESLLEDFDCIIADESTAIKSSRAKVTQTLLRICDAVRYKICLSGLPTPKSWHDIFSQVAFLGDGYFMGMSNYFRWRNKNFTQGFETHDYYLTPKQQKRVKDEFQRHAFSLTRKQAGIAETKLYTRRGVTLSPRDRRYYDYVERFWESPDRTFSTKYAPVVATHLRQFVSEAKEEVFKAILDDIPPGESFVVWVAFNFELDIVSDILRERSIRHYTMSGETKLSNRRRAIQGFRQGNRRSVVCQMACAKFGIKLDKANIAIYYSTSYNYEDRAQTEDRIVSVGKSDPLLIFDIVARDTIDETVHENLQEKKTDARFLMARVRSRKDDRVDERRSRHSGNRNRNLARK